jgi:membrane-bound lytic murein transglycosylase D
MNRRVYIIAALIGICTSLLVVTLFSFVLKSKPTKQENQAYFDVINGRYRIYALPLPDQLEFAGEMVPFDDTDARERFDRELLVNVYWHSNTLLSIKRAYRWFPIIEPILKANEIPDDFKYLAVIESGLTNASSPAGAKGFWQFLEETGTSYGLEITDEVDERYHVEKSTYAACHFLKDAYDRHGSWAMAAASYNMGMGGLQRQVTRQGETAYWDLLLNEETGRYVYRILAMKEIFNHADQYGFVIRPAELYEPYRFQMISVDSSISDLAVFAKQQGTNYKMLKVYNPWLRENFLRNKERKKYEFKIPQ